MCIMNLFQRKRRVQNVPRRYLKMKNVFVDQQKFESKWGWIVQACVNFYI